MKKFEANRSVCKSQMNEPTRNKPVNYLCFTHCETEVTFSRILVPEFIVCDVNQSVLLIIDIMREYYFFSNDM